MLAIAANPADRKAPVAPPPGPLRNFWYLALNGKQLKKGKVKAVVLLDLRPQLSNPLGSCLFAVCHLPRI